MEGLFPNAREPLDDLRRSLEQKPARIDNAFIELLSGYGEDPRSILTTTAEIPEGSEHRGVVLTTDIPFVSMCPHHFLPFFGTVDLVYVPGSKILGLGKIPRLIRGRSRRLQIQEFLVRDLANDLMEFGDARWVSVRSRAKHLCICYRGPDEPATENVTTYSLGELPDHLLGWSWPVPNGS